MHTVFKSTRGRLAASATAVMGLVIVGGCQQRAVPQPRTVTPQPVAAPQPIYADPQADIYAAPQPTQPIYTNQQPIDTYATTYAVGEEDGSGPIPVEPNGGIGSGAGPIPVDYSYGTPPIGEVEGDYERVFIPPE